MQTARVVATTVIVVVVASGCASSKQVELQEAVRKAAKAPVAEDRGDVPAVFRDLAESGGLDPRTVYVALQNSDSLNAAAVGNHHFYVTRGVVVTGDRCLLTGIAAHEIAHDILRHPETIAKTSDVTSVVGTVLGTAAGAFVPGAGYLVQGATSLGLKAYSRNQESEADALAIKILLDAGKPEWSLRYALETLRQRTGGSSGGWLSTHPAMDERIASQPPLDIAEVRRICGSAPTDPPAACRGGNGRRDPDTQACITGDGK